MIYSEEDSAPVFLTSPFTEKHDFSQKQIKLEFHIQLRKKIFFLVRKNLSKNFVTKLAAGTHFAAIFGAAKNSCRNSFFTAVY